MKTIVTVALLCAATLTFAQTKQIDLSEFMKQTQKWHKEGEEMKMAWWIPTDYWRIALEGNKDVPAEVVSQLENVFDEYVLIFAASINIGSSGVITGVEEEVLAKSLVVVDQNGKKHSPLKRSEINSDALQIEANMKPMFAQSMGQMGQAMHLFFFKIQGADQKNLIAASKEGGFTVQHSSSEFKWVLPLPILMPDKFCPTDKAIMRGDWTFCPYHGVKLN